MVQVIVTRVTGSIVCQLEIDAELGWTVQDVKARICKYEGVCPCKQQIVADSEILRDGSLLKEHIAECSSQLSLTLLFRSMDLEKLHMDLEKLHEDVYFPKRPLPHGLCHCGSRCCLSHRASATKAAGLRKEGFCASCLMKEASFHGLTLLDAGFHAHELRDIGVSAGHLCGLSARPKCLYKPPWRDVFCGADASELRQMGFGAKEILDAGFMLEDCMSFGVNEILDAGVKLEALISLEYEYRVCIRDGCDMGCDIEERFAYAYALTPPDFNVRRLLDAVDVKQIRDEWVRVGRYTRDEHPCFNAREFLDAGINLEQLLAGGFQFVELMHAGVDVWKLIGAGFDPYEPQDFEWQCADAKRLQRAGFCQQLPEFLDVEVVKCNWKRGRQRAKAYRQLQRTKRNRKGHRQQAKARGNTKSWVQQDRRVCVVPGKRIDSKHAMHVDSMNA